MVDDGTPMSSLEQDLRQQLLPSLPAADIDTALRELGPQRLLETAAIARADRAALVDRFVRNLKRLGSEEQLRLETSLLKALGCQPEGEWQTHLDSAVALIELRGHMKHTLGVLGFDWVSLSRLQSLVGGVARWLQGSGGGTLQVHSSSERVEFVIATKDSELTPDLVVASPMVQMLRANLAELIVREAGDQVEITFRIQRSREGASHDHAA